MSIQLLARCANARVAASVSRVTSSTPAIRSAAIAGARRVVAGSCSMTGRSSVLDVQPEKLHQRIGLVFGSKNEVERIERYHREPANETRNPLFAERGLFRD